MSTIGELGLEDRLGRRLGVPGIVGLEDAAKARRLAGIARALEHRAEAGGDLVSPCPSAFRDQSRQRRRLAQHRIVAGVELVPAALQRLAARR